MKKLVFVFIAMVAMTLASCGDKTTTVNTPDTAAVDTVDTVTVDSNVVK